MSSVKSAHVDTFAADRLPAVEDWPEFRFDLPELQYPARLNCAMPLLENRMQDGEGGRTAVFSEYGQWSYEDLDRRANQFANLLTGKLGLVPGNRVLLRSANNPLLAAAWFGVMKAGGIAVTTMPMLRQKELAVAAQKAEISHALCDTRLESELDAAAAQTGLLQRRAGFDCLAPDALLGDESPEFATLDTAADDVALLAFTSGTTGQPKATMHFHRDVMAMADIVGGRLLETRPTDIYVGSPPLGFTFGLGASLVFPLRFGGAVAYVEAPTPEGLLSSIEKNGVTGLFTAPTMYRAMLPLAGNYDLGSLRFAFSAGEMLPKPTSDAWFDATGMRIIDGIGATEMIHVFISATGDDIRPGATGKPLPGYQACVLGDDDRPLPPGSTGRLAVKGPTGCRYLDDERQKAYVIDGWNVTGDRYTVDEDGYFWFQARADDMILSAGYNIAGPEVESALLAHDAVAECAVVGAPDEERGHIVKAFVVPAAGITPSDELTRSLQDFVKQTIAPYKYPRAIEYLDALPKTQTGKVQRFRLRESRQGSAR